MTEMQTLDLAELQHVEGGIAWIPIIIVAAVLLYSSPAH